ncbi:uncharacterized protein LOC107265698 [Cephus cinctus]|uniref:Uncharacterized protein LOC107265698 n=1 Tax=Cephus cinctus TaxID=211228 RepID=A0AAJ7FGN1_CEPCN|nr:uncharacterized protein LOC107265698 [Cephus cinctus]XP_015590904.1 uncharacterized protein LOC107265698 [Cephus cinctus]
MVCQAVILLALVAMMIATTIAAQNPFDASSVYSGKANIGPLFTSGLSATQNSYRDNSYEDNAVTPTPSAPSGGGSTGINFRSSAGQAYRKVSGANLEPAREYQHQVPVRVTSAQPRGPAIHPTRGGAHPQFVAQNGDPRLEAEELEEEKDEPDRLAILLQQSKFDCINKQTGYYADEELNCEVFHYCQDNAKHSWICPEGFTFHQVHLICMPPNGDITCKKSSQYHFVNEYLYKPLNLAEAENKPNVTLRYSERFYPANIYTDERESGDYQITPTGSSGGGLPRRPLPQQVFLGQQPSLGPLSQRSQPQIAPQFRVPVNQVFRSPEEVNIPLQQRRPQPQPQSQPLRRFPQVRPDDDDYE